MSRKPSPMDPFLARALSALEEMEGKPVQAGGKTLPLEVLVPSPQPRKRFENLEALAESIREKGVLQPLLVRPLGDGRYAIVAGERRYRAARMAGLSEVPVRVVELSEKEARLLALVENLQREDLNPYEETVGVLALLSEDLGKPVEEVVGLLHRMQNEKRGKATQNVLGSPEARRVEEVFKALGRMTWESFVQARLPLLSLPEDLKAALEEGAIPYTAALELKKVKDEASRKVLLEEARAGLSLRELRARVREVLRKEKAPRPWYREVGERLLRLDLEALPPERRALVERKLKELEELLG
ncbi:ParB/RepB/Spo0J family partition protein [Thermus thermophilus]|jgi:ParB family chromosome partitioning protein|uniref:ParB-like partition protein n=3 Tax=Thermus TaxID=270 RepID=G9MB58_THET8|nr:ParB/RepB/Spo0J family partition protein [Thermus thermophilus]BAL42520.1 ParB-like partition protein [Thermus thermophilus HB8]BDE46661.1 chromosome partitioning protein ParB [Thermus thermophilus]HAH41409.1 ParB/RepB/Spo0J family partition protein [Thermus sp.]